LEGEAEEVVAEEVVVADQRRVKQLLRLELA
jgi:hypothetical protein